MQAEINEVADNLLNAMLNLRYKADKSILEEVVAESRKWMRMHTQQKATQYYGSGNK